jgi:hypothetical protein
MTDSSAAVGEMSRAELEECVENLRSEIAELESTVEDVRSGAGKDRANIHGRISDLEGDLDERLGAFENRLDSLEGHVTDNGGGRKSATKQDHAETIARNEGVRVADQGLRGGAIDYPTIRDIAERQYDTTLHSGTVYAAFDELAKKWECFSVHDGGDGPNTKNKHLRVERDEIPPALENLATEGPAGESVSRGGN